jgi:hypothetical protein
MVGERNVSVRGGIGGGDGLGANDVAGGDGDASGWDGEGLVGADGEVGAAAASGAVGDAGIESPPQAPTSSVSATATSARPSDQRRLTALSPGRG